MPNSATFQQNIALLRRFDAQRAELLAALPLWEREKSAADSKLWLERLNISDVSILFVYNLNAQGEEFLALKSWVEKSPMRSVIFLVDDLPLARAFLETATATELLTHSQFAFKLFDWDTLNNPSLLQQEFDWLLKAFSIVKTAFSPKIGADQSEYNRLLFLKKQIQQQFDEWLSTYHNYLETQKKVLASFYPNILEIPNASLGQAMSAAHSGAFKNIPAIICGAGPSLEQHLEKIKSLQDKALIFGAGSSLNVLSRHGILPHFAGGLDPSETQLSRLSTNFAFQVPFFYVNRFNHSALRYVQGDKIYLPGGTRLHVGDWFDAQLKLNLGEPIPSGKSTSNFCLEIAGLLGCNPIVLIGMDLSYTQSKRYSAGVTAHPVDSPQHHQGLAPSKDRAVKIRGFDGCEYLTTRNWLLEADCFTDFCSRYPHLTVLNATEGGMPIEGIPNAILDRIAEAHLQVSYDFDELVHSLIQNNPSLVSIEQVQKALEHWQKTLEESKNTILAYLNRGDYSKGVLTSLLQPFDSYPAFLMQYDTLFDSLNSRDNFRLTHFPEAHPAWMQKEMIERMELERARFLLDKINDHASKTREALAMLPSYPVEPKSTPGGKRSKLVETLCSVSNDETIKNFYYSTGELYAVKRYRSGLLHGKQEFYYLNGAVRTELNYHEGLLDGKVRLFYLGNRLKRELHFAQGQLQGQEKEWNEAGQLIKEAHYQANNPIGTSRAWHANGMPAREVVHHTDGEYDELTEWDINGKETLSAKFPPKTLTDTLEK